jgi:hypothetical protein
MCVWPDGGAAMDTSSQYLLHVRHWVCPCRCLPDAVTIPTGSGSATRRLIHDGTSVAGEPFDRA